MLTMAIVALLLHPIVLDKKRSTIVIIIIVIIFFFGISITINLLVGLVVKASASRSQDPGFESRLCRDFSGVESYE